ncbi:pyrroloquinoline quinone biosynthesis protein PqqB [Oceanicella actignis]|uniref:pyrroloquinoline quinone biosynthesis protein PqqB n=1 Tax=Oceanicella actignis TaxID=1189325 RepID=UPI0011E6D78F|nr:pyrroloquinoline quinone biosynthesis protein PqqB [Oceanicella actignis]TYO90578.1 pyrroloquinoline quinone biosynthesis protein B [Oceanicella actignis]
MRLKVLGAAAGGGLPQWNCGCANCNAARAGRIPALTQSSICVSADGESWAVINASPDIRAQIAATPELHPRALRHSPIASVLVTNGDIDHVAGLLILREKTAFDLFATPAIHAVLADNPIFGALDPALVARRTVALERPFSPAPGLSARLFAVPGKVPLYLEGEEERLVTDAEGEQTVGVALRAEAGGPEVFYIPGCARMTPALAERLRGAALVLFDGTVWEDDEMPRAGAGAKTGKRMGHMSMRESIAAFAPLGVARKVFVHINNTNPALDPASPERAEAEAAGWTIAHDGMELAP